MERDRACRLTSHTQAQKHLVNTCSAAHAPSDERESVSEPHVRLPVFSDKHRLRKLLGSNLLHRFPFLRPEIRK